MLTHVIPVPWDYLLRSCMKSYEAAEEFKITGNFFLKKQPFLSDLYRPPGQNCFEKLFMFVLMLGF